MNSNTVVVNNSTGEFKRRDAAWRNWIKAGGDFPPEKDRYHLYVAYACPWAHSTLMVRALKGLEEVITVSVVHPTWQKTKPDDAADPHNGWVFPTKDSQGFTNTIGLGGPFPGQASMLGLEGQPEPVFGAKSIREIYETCGDTDRLYTVPILFDKKLKTIVSNESSEIIRMLNSEFNDYAKNPNLDLYPDAMQDAVQSVYSWMYPNINNGVYRCGFAKSQDAYDKAIDVLTTAFDKADAILQKQRYIAGDGDKLTLADLRLFMTLLRFDEVYVVYFKTNTRSVRHTPALLNFCREIYQLSGISDTVNMDHIKQHYYTSHPTYNHFSIIPRGANFEELLKQPHDRDNFGQV